MKIRLSHGGPRRKTLEFGDRKMIGGVEHVRCRATVNIGTQEKPKIAFNCTGGRQCVEWLPVDDVAFGAFGPVRKREGLK